MTTDNIETGGLTKETEQLDEVDLQALEELIANANRIISRVKEKPDNEQDLADRGELSNAQHALEVLPEIAALRLGGRNHPIIEGTLPDGTAVYIEADSSDTDVTKNTIRYAISREPRRDITHGQEYLDRWLPFLLERRRRAAVIRNRTHSST